MFEQGKVNSARYIAQVLNPVPQSFIRQEGDVLFQQDNARQLTAAATQPALRDTTTALAFSRACHKHC